ncbi:MAG: motility associated factor glycosyltransferase family protein [Candidatus Riflebacteria bacterium]|nr:motility associated factor glycosyltransferase family protein [Candidatus Riflebacteria bacterium]
MLQDYLENNIKYLNAHQGIFSFVQKLLKIYKTDNYKVEEAKNGDVTLAVLDTSGKALSYHSKYNPTREAQQIIEKQYKNESHAVILGFGMGYTSEIILEKLPVLNMGPQLFIVEPDPFVFITALKYRDLSRLLSDSRVHISLGSDADAVGEVWNAAIDWSVLSGMAIIEHQPSKSRFSLFFDKLLEKMKYLANRSRGNFITLMNVGWEFHRNNFMNLQEAFGLPGSERLFDKFTNVPAIIVAAGPSLDKNMEYLKRVKGRFPIIAVDTAYRHLLANGIKPDFVCAADSSYENSLDFVGVEDETEVILVAELMTHPDIFKVFKGRKIITTFGGGLYPQISKFREPMGSLICWGSVATMAFDLARKMGADPIIFIGFDLSFCDGRLHTRGSYSEDILYENLHPFTSMENETSEYICERGRFQFMGDDGKLIYTDTNMKAYKDWFEDQFQHTEAKVINATEGGIVNNFVEKMTLNQAIDKYFDKSIDVKSRIEDCLKMPVKADYNALHEFLASRKELIEDFCKKIEVVKPLLKELSDSISDKNLNEIKGKESEKLAIVMNIHDQICDNPAIVEWFAALNTKFVTKHTSEVVKLRGLTEVKVGQWLQIVDNLFSNYEEFARYQLPLVKAKTVS